VGSSPSLSSKSLKKFKKGWIRLIYFLYLKYKNKEMEIIKLINDTWQLIDEQGSVLKQGSYNECLDRLCEIENAQYRDFLMMSGI
jgi:hypothetical protein